MSASGAQNIGAAAECTVSMAAQRLDPTTSVLTNALEYKVDRHREVD